MFCVSVCVKKHPLEKGRCNSSNTVSVLLQVWFGCVVARFGCRASCCLGCGDFVVVVLWFFWYEIAFGFAKAVKKERGGFLEFLSCVLFCVCCS
jgi:hypothetical protein